jgi:hypothetical protein
MTRRDMATALNLSKIEDVFSRQSEEARQLIKMGKMTTCDAVTIIDRLGTRTSLQHRAWYDHRQPHLHGRSGFSMPPLASIAVMATFGFARKFVMLYSIASLRGINVFWAVY